jgi:hypothetical protein
VIYAGYSVSIGWYSCPICQGRELVISAGKTEEDIACFSKY